MIAILNGPNLDRLGKREPEIYGSESLADLEKRLRTEASELGVELDFYQSNHEGALVDKIHALTDSGCTGVILNGAAYTHTSVALRDAISASGLNVIEVHISNVYKREVFRHKSFTAGVSVGVISGLGFDGYSYALHYLAKQDG